MAQQIHVGVGTYIGGGVTVIPVWTESAESRGYCWKPTHLQVGELAEGATVNFLEVTNNGTRAHVVVEGDIFEGGWQTRSAAQTVIIKRGETARIPVVCVEHGRWGGDRLHRVGRMRKTPYRSRTRMNSSLARQYKEVRDSGMPIVSFDASGHAQHEMWDDISAMQSTRGFVAGQSLAMSMDDVKTRIDAGQMLGRTQRSQADPSLVSILPGQRGVMIGVGGRIVAAEIFGSTAGLRERFDAIVESAIYEALDAPDKATPNYRARDFARAISENTPVGETLEVPAEVTTSVGPLAVTSFAIANTLVHAAVFSQAPIDDELVLA